VLLFLLLACAQNDAPTCPPCPAGPEREEAGQSLAAWEAALLQPTLEELRQGVRTWGEMPFGVCSGKRDCEEYLGAEPGLLAPGNFFVRTELKAPAVGEEWAVTFHIDCTTSDAKGKESSQEHEKTYTVKHTGKERGFRLQPLWTIQSPHPSGARSCSFTLTPLRTDGVAGEPWKGSYKTPAP